MKKLLAAVLVALALIGCAPDRPMDLVSERNRWAYVIDDFCSGEAVDSERELVATAAHCVRGIPDKQEIPIWRVLFDEEGTEQMRILYTAVVYKKDEEHDVALLKVIRGDVTDAVKLATEPVRYGDIVYTVGNPMLMLGVIAQGKVVKPKYWLIGGPVNTEVFLYDAYHDNGSSGGAVLNVYGELVGLSNFTIAQGGDPDSIKAGVSVKYLKVLLDA